MKDLEKSIQALNLKEKSNIEAQLRELEVKESDLLIRMKNAPSNNVKSLIANLIDANRRKRENLELELEELNILDKETLNIQSTPLAENDKAKIQKKQCLL